MADEDDEFFEAFEDLPPSPPKLPHAQKSPTPQGLKPQDHAPSSVNASVNAVANEIQPLGQSEDSTRERSRTFGGTDYARGTSLGDFSRERPDLAVAQGPSPRAFARERSATVGSAPQGVTGFRDADLAVWKSGPSSVRERRERFWQSQGGGPLPGMSSSNLPPAPGSLPARRGSATQARGSRTDQDAGKGAVLEKRRSSEGERRLTIGFDSKPQPKPADSLPPPVAFVVSSQGSAPIGDGRGASGLTSALANHIPQLLKDKAASDPLPRGDEQRGRSETAPAVYATKETSRLGAASFSETRVHSESVNGPRPAHDSRPPQSQSVSSNTHSASQSKGQSICPGGQSSVIPRSAPPLEQLPALPPLQTIASPEDIVPALPAVTTAKARPWPRRHVRTPSGSDPDSQPATTPPHSGGASPLAPKSPLQQGVNAAKHLLGQVANHLGGQKTTKPNGPSDGSPSSSVGTELERDVLRLGAANEAEFTPPDFVRSQSEQALTLPEGGLPVSPTGDVVYRIKNLDTGKEFFLEQSLGNRVIDVNSGKELSIDEVEETLGLSPVSREVQRREWLAEGGEEEFLSPGARPESESDPGPGGGREKKKKNWLNKAVKKGAAYYEKGRRKLQRDDSGSGSDTDRRPFVHGRGFTDARIAGYGPGYEAGPNGKGSVKVHVQRKAFKELTDVRVGQEIKAHEGPIWCMKFNSDGRFLVTGGKDGLVKVWEVVDKLPPTPLQASGDFDELVSAAGIPTAAASDDAPDDVTRAGGRDRSTSWGASFWLADVAYRTLRGHSSDVLEVSWSKNTQFLLSSSMDTTVRLWHVSMDECLRVFPHSDFVTCLDFNPVDDKYFLSGSLDNKIRIWNIPEHRVVDWTDAREMVTACTYTADGSGAIVGSYEGTCRFYTTRQHMLQLDGTLDVRSTRGKNAQGKKVTGVQCMPGDPRKILVTSNDSRLRVYDGMKLQCKYRGHANANSQKVATFSASGDFLICPSEDGFVYVWNAANSYVPPYGGFRRDHHQSCEYFYSSGVNVAVAWGGPKGGGSDSDGSQSKSRSRANSGGSVAARGEITSAGGVRVPGRGAREVPPGSWPKEALGARGEAKASEEVAGGRNGPGPWAEPQQESEKEKESAPTANSEASAAAEAAVASAAAVGLVIVTANYQGEIRTFKNFGRPVWL